MRPRRGGEPHRRAVRAVRRPRVFRHDGGQPAAHVVLGNGLRSRRDLASRRPAPYPVRRRRSRHHPAQAVEARCSGAHQRSPHSLRSRIRLSEQNRVRDGASLSAARVRLLLNPTPSRNQQGSVAPPADTRQLGLALRETQHQWTRDPRTSNHRAPASTPRTPAALENGLRQPRKRHYNGRVEKTRLGEENTPEL